MSDVKEKMSRLRHRTLSLTEQIMANNKNNIVPFIMLRRNYLNFRAYKNIKYKVKLST